MGNLLGKYIYWILFSGIAAITFPGCSPSEVLPGYKIESDQRETYIGREVHFNLTPSVQNYSCTWHFEGAIPEQSNDLQPIVTYTKEGSFPVWVEIHQNGNVVTVREEDFIRVASNPATLFNFYALKANKTTIKTSERVQLEALVLGDSVKYQWGTDFGGISGNGSNVEFYMCANVRDYEGDVHITCKAWNEHGAKDRQIVIHIVK